MNPKAYLRFVHDGRDGWRSIGDTPASVEIQQSVVDRRITQDVELARVARLARDGRSGPRLREGVRRAIGRLAGLRRPEAAPRPTRPAAPTHCTDAAPRPACQG